jgi:hypothetical protein
MEEGCALRADFVTSALIPPVKDQEKFGASVDRDSLPMLYFELEVSKS